MSLEQRSIIEIILHSGQAHSWEKNKLHSDVHVREVPRGVHKLSQILHISNPELRFSRGSIEIRRELLKGVMEREESSKMLVKLEDSDCIQRNGSFVDRFRDQSRIVERPDWEELKPQSPGIKREKVRIPNVVARLMGLDELLPPPPSPTSVSKVLDGEAKSKSQTCKPDSFGMKRPEQSLYGQGIDCDSFVAFNPLVLSQVHSEKNKQSKAGEKKNKEQRSRGKHTGLTRKINYKSESKCGNEYYFNTEGRKNILEYDIFWYQCRISNAVYGTLAKQKYEQSKVEHGTMEEHQSTTKVAKISQAKENSNSRKNFKEKLIHNRLVKLQVRRKNISENSKDGCSDQEKIQPFIEDGTKQISNRTKGAIREKPSQLQNTIEHHQKHNCVVLDNKIIRSKREMERIRKRIGFQSISHEQMKKNIVQLKDNAGKQINNMKPSILNSEPSHCNGELWSHGRSLKSLDLNGPLNHGNNFEQVEMEESKINDEIFDSKYAKNRNSEKNSYVLTIAKTLFKLNIPNDDHSATKENPFNGNNKLLIECIVEVMTRKSHQEEVLAMNLTSLIKKERSLDSLIKELNQDLERLKNSSEMSDEGREDMNSFLQELLEKEIENRNPNANCMWDFGWKRNSLAYFEKQEVARDLEKYILRSLIKEVVQDF